ncbi:Protein_farnesyltransferase subunit beta [Hexamita inflata]|uniref:Geranylgeranyl transferase type II subunit beta n=1 Tax=Hexamita inflata TaxID=28002 RepID=A0AA86RPS4_9EUKA|nr:Protein farnesyltransferase subunit beta [Hexamita inflata]
MSDTFDQLISDFYAKTPLRGAFDFYQIYIFLENHLNFLSRSLETTRSLQIYWTLFPYMLSIRQLKVQLDELVNSDLWVTFELDLIKERLSNAQRKLDQLKPMILETLSTDFCQREFYHFHIMNAYGAVLSLKMLNFDLNQLTQNALFMLTELQAGNGAFRANTEGESDVRTTFAAVVIGKLTGLLNEPIFAQTRKYLMSQQSQQGGFCSNELEPHAEYTYCALAALKILNVELNAEEKSLHLHYLVNRQTKWGGFNGRPYKDPESCYSWWVLGALHILGKDKLKLVNKDLFDKFVLNCCQPEGGCGLRDKPGVEPDAYHTAYVLGGWSIINEALDDEEVCLGICM